MTDKKKMLLSAPSDEIRQILSRAYDLYEKAYFAKRPFFTKFLTPLEKHEIDMRFEKGGDAPLSFFGGSKDSERCLACFGEADEKDFPIRIIVIKAKNDSDLKHRDVMGTILSLGIERELVGDIIVDASKAYVFALSEMADYIKDNLSKIASVGVKCELKDLEDIDLPERKYEEKRHTLSSMRLDCAVSAVTGLSRGNASALIEKGLVSVNHQEMKNLSAPIKDADIITVRGTGKFLVKTDLSLSKKGRVLVTFLKYV